MDDLSIGDDVRTGWFIYNGQTEEELLQYQSTVVRVQIHAKVTEIPRQTFSQWPHLREVQASHSSQLETIGESAFRSCFRLQSVDLRCASQLNRIERDAWGYCLGLTEIHFANERQELLPPMRWEDAIFEGCTALVHIELPPNLQHVGDQVFCSCESLEHFVIPWAAIPRGTFSGCQSLSHVEFLSQQDLTDIGDEAFVECALTNIDFPPTIQRIGDAAFYLCQHLERISNLSLALTSLGDEAFFGCENLREINLQPCTSLTELPRRVFADCSNLQTVELPTSIGLVSEGAFSGCTSLTSLQWPKSCTGIPDNCFNGCRGLTKILFQSNSLSRIGQGAFYGCHALKDVKLPDSVRFIENSAFIACLELPAILVLPLSLRYLGEAAFADCGGLVAVVLPPRLHSVGREAFYRCHSLSSVSIARMPCVLWPKLLMSLSSAESTGGQLHRAGLNFQTRQSSLFAYLCENIGDLFHGGVAFDAGEHVDKSGIDVAQSPTTESMGENSVAPGTARRTTFFKHMYWRNAAAM